MVLVTIRFLFTPGQRIKSVIGPGQSKNFWCIIKNMNFDLITIAVGVLFAWVIALTILLVQTSLHFRRLTKNVSKKDLKTVLEDILAKTDLNQKQIQAVAGNLKKLDSKSLGFIQKIGFVRFNPFNQTGGDQSFCLALLDAKANGFVLSSLHSRESTRFYAKTVKEGGGDGHELSKEERQAVTHAQ
ncbi:hypothetical protein COW80_00070 [Candidatus Beckwithbacteria bacterium CG22_combo_CG10-13_8_21_14_all_01_47_9]|uniref:DUF4446 domain-containing protein n=5 Tax=Candidatus Beckwithiibacteriota TaxID=1752726 RepID=A0A2H0E3I8_9BACT|nr:MAG: hypothetical protein COX09_02815 [Candidatus Beckwithbacteria bacterium CG23_combo_of_CG06-09_8_20_14_all_47_9]PIP88489.1 MAG: hypothetical protein COW80_00070 [Candidatus Beckwithbacteria bacterium CG22_combo_CG10-13_8_21_14_all_01_47_9]PJA23003.1 MAG: hypothetical protein COX59_01535 [Candidatus Beckwithbacteria bacterium CG_4_10_14_0_2_um_filter_47_25]PJC66691.1 MAG: hypothetical protein CO018_00640 [Candidatus Beckwithbacteria bacterium CG_4_9_14_0_2_um_filter_47_11]